MRIAHPLEAGLSLVEMMVAMAISLVLALGLVAFIASGRQGFRAQAADARMQETGRLGTELLAYDLRMAGYMGCPTLRRVTPRDVANPPGDFAFDADNLVFGHDAAGVNWVPVLPADLAAATSGTDVIRTQRAGDCGAWLTAGMGSDSADIVVAAANGCGFEAQDLLMVVDCGSADIIRASSVTVGGANEAIAHALSDNTSSRLSKAYGVGAQVFKLQTTSYYVAPGASGEPALFRLIDDGAAEELVEGVENLQVLYGEDVDGDLSVDRYVERDDATLQMDRVVSLRTSMLVRTLEDNISVVPQTYTFDGAQATANDGRSRRVFTATFNLRDRSS